LKDGGDNWFAEGDGYACSSSKFDLDNGSTLEIRNVRVLAFAQLTEDKFPTGQVFSECAADSKTSEIVPIIVGACLGRCFPYVVFLFKPLHFELFGQS
jgi:hypothetical protein